jgi:peptidoglycan/xylan/chitin deacetylase (PgdA/CDA1 family)
MRVIVACTVVVLSILAAIALARTNVLAPLTPSSASAPAERVSAPAQAKLAVVRPPANPITTVATDASPAPVLAPATASAAPSVANNAPERVAQAGVRVAENTTSLAAPTAAPIQVAQAAAPPAAAPPAAAPPTASPPAAAAPAPAAQAVSCPGNPNALGVARTVQIDTTGGPGFGFEHFKTHDFLKPGEVVLTFDDGPWQNNTPAVLAALARHCTKATFFPIGKHATYYPEILRQVAAAGHTVGSHTWSHADLSKVKNPEDAKAEIEKGISAVHWALEGAPMAPFFRFPALQHPPEMVTYLGERNIAIISTDMDSFDFKMRKPEQVIKSVMDKLKKHGKGIVLMHDFQHATAEGIGTLLDQLKLNGYKIVHMTAKSTLQTLPAYDEMMVKEQKLPTVSTRPTSDVVKTINE